jgi:predicted ribosomally synthesized peptide with nif11-like leader
MSIAEIERFAADVQSNAALRAEVEACAKASPPQSADGLIALATAKGYSFTESELKEKVAAAAKPASGGLTDAQLDGVAGGNLGGFSFGGSAFDFVFGNMFAAVWQANQRSSSS